MPLNQFRKFSDLIQSQALTHIAGLHNGQTACQPMANFLSTLGEAFGSWYDDVSYTAGDKVTGSDGNVYEAVETTIGDNPVDTEGGEWRLSLVNQNITLNIPSRFDGFQDAWDFINNAGVVNSATVTIQFANGTHSMGSSRFKLNHPFSGQIKILGNVTDNTLCILDWSGSTYDASGLSYATDDIGAMYVNHGNHSPYINGFKMIGNGRDKKYYGLYAFNGATLNCGPKMWVTDFYAGVTAYIGSSAFVDGIRVSNGGDGNLFAYMGSFISARECISEGADVYFAKSGALAEHGSAIFAPNGIFRNNTGSQARCNFGSSLMMLGATFLVEGGLIGTARGVDMLLSDNCDLSGATFNGCPAPRSRNLNIDTEAATFTRRGVVDEFPLAAPFQDTMPEGFVASYAMVQQNIGAVWLGMLASAANGIVATSGAQMSFRIGENATLAAGMLVGAFSAQGFQPPCLSSDPASPTNNFMWVNTTSNVLKIRLNGVTKTVTTS